MLKQQTARTKKKKQTRASRTSFRITNRNHLFIDTNCKSEIARRKGNSAAASLLFYTCFLLRKTMMNRANGSRGCPFLTHATPLVSDSRLSSVENEPMDLMIFKFSLTIRATLKRQHRKCRNAKSLETKGQKHYRHCHRRRQFSREFSSHGQYICELCFGKIHAAKWISERRRDSKCFSNAYI